MATGRGHNLLYNKVETASGQQSPNIRSNPQAAWLSDVAVVPGVPSDSIWPGTDTAEFFSLTDEASLQLHRRFGVVIQQRC